MDNVLEQLSIDIFKFLRQMDDEANTPSGHCEHAGLVDYIGFKGISGKKYEECWNNRLAELLKDNENTVSMEYQYPSSQKRCDIVIENNNIIIWLEVKAAWKYWFSSKTGKVEKNNSSFYRSYIFGNLEEGLKKSHSVAQDIEKLNKLSKGIADYVGLLIIGFDISDDPIDPDMEQLIETMNLRKDGWEIYGPEIWLDRNHPDCRYNCWFLGKRVLDI